MGWKISTILIKPGSLDRLDQLKEVLQLSEEGKTHSKPLEEVLFPTDDMIYIGQYRDCLVLTGAVLAFEFYNPQSSALGKALTHVFPQAEILALSLHSAVNHWGFALLKNGKTIRVKTGDAEQGVILEAGSPLAEETALLSQSIVEKNGKRIFYLAEDGARYTEDQMGESFVFALSERMLGSSLEMLDEDFFELEMQGFQLGKFKEKTTANTRNSTFIAWLILAFVLGFFVLRKLFL